MMFFRVLLGGAMLATMIGGLVGWSIGVRQVRAPVSDVVSCFALLFLILFIGMHLLATAIYFVATGEMLWGGK